ncbi:MAG: histidine phosphatase family protein [Burkholderiales bacterium]
MQTLLFLIRHGETAWNVEGRIQGHVDQPLNDTGLAQARAVGNRFRAETLDGIYASDLTRAMQTAQPVADATALTIVPDPALRERHLGVLQGLTGDEARGRTPAVWTVFRTRAPNADLEAGESLAEFSTRVLAALEGIAREKAGKRIAIVTHGGVLDAAYRRARGIPLDLPRDFPIYNASVNLLGFDGARFEVLRWGDVSHLPEELSLDDP